MYRYNLRGGGLGGGGLSKDSFGGKRSRLIALVGGIACGGASERLAISASNVDPRGQGANCAFSAAISSAALFGGDLRGVPCAALTHY